MGVMGVPPSVLRSRPLSVWTSKMGLFTAKKPGLPHPVMTCLQSKVIPAHAQARP